MSRPGGPPQGPPHGQPLSFKTVPGRNRTQKWQQAKTYNYDGDDWGGYDPYDEYSGYDDQSYHNPGPVPPRAGRTTSFDRGDERRNFSAGPVLYEDAAAESAAMGPSDQIRTRPRDFTNPEHVPPPLATRVGPSPAGFPPRKESIGSDAQPRPSSSSTDAEKPLPFIRPSDIYKRIAEEREKEKLSLDSGRPSMDSIRREGTSSGNMSSDNLPQNLTSVAETAEPETPQKTTFLPATSVPRKEPALAASIPTSLPQVESAPVATAPGLTLPEVSRFSGFGSDFWSGTKLEASQSDDASQVPAGAQAAPQPAVSVDSKTAVDLQHQPSVGLRSVVHTAFDRQTDNSVPPTPASGHDSSGAGVSRSNTDSTSGISPIMSRVPSAATAQQRQQEVNTQVPPIQEEPTSAHTPVQSRPASSMPESRVTSGEIPIGVQGFQPGYRRSLDPPSQDSSRAMTPQIEDTTNRRLSGPLSASVETAGDPLVNASTTELKSVSSGNSRLSDSVEEYTKALPVGTRGRSGTNYSLREADLANAVSAAPSDPSFSPEVAHAETASREQFLREHEPPSASLSPIKTGGPELSPSGLQSPPDSPTKGRVRDLAGKYQEIHNASRRGSQASLGSRKSSWSQFRGSEENLAQKRQQAEDADGTRESGSETVKFPEYDNSGSSASKPLAAPTGSLAPTRPGVDSQQSFRPQIPGGWESFAPTPASEEPPARSAAEGGSLAPPRTPAEEIDLSPTTQKVPLTERGPHASNLALQSAGAALGASLVASAGLNSKAQDFASGSSAAQVDQPELRSKPAIGAIASSQPPLLRGDSEITDAPTSKASSRPPTPPGKDASTPTATKAGDEHFNGSIPPTVPLKYGASRRGTGERSTGLLEPDASYDARHLSTEAGVGDTESDRLRKEIVRSLGSTEDVTSDAAVRTQDALDVSARPAMLPTIDAPSRPHLPQRFSWEDPTYETSAPAPVMSAQAMPSHLDPQQLPEIMPEMPYERPRSRGLHIVNTQAGDGTIGETPTSPENAQARGILAAEPSKQEHEQVSTLTEVSSPPLVESRPSAERPSSYDTDVKAPIQNDDDDAHLRDLGFAPVSPISPLVEKAPLVAPETPTKQSPTSPRPGSGEQRIPAFREILAIKSPSERITAYNQTRQTFAQMDTGLGDWLSTMAQHPDHANLQPAPIADYKRPGIQTAGIGTFGRHKHSPSLMKFTNQFRGASEGSASGERKPSFSGAAGLDVTDSAPIRSASSNNWGGEGEGRRMNVDMDKMQQRGKDLIKNAGVLGGKAQAGAKGLFAKGKSRFGGKRETAPLPPSEDKPLVTQQSAPETKPSVGQPVPATATAVTDAEAPTSTSLAVTAPVPRRFTPTPSPLKGIEVLRSQNNTPSSYKAPSRDLSQSPAPGRPKGPPRSQTHTPSSHSRSLSQTWSRLSRSISRSSRSRSRPTSMVVTSQEVPRSGEPSDFSATALIVPSDAEVSSTMQSPQSTLPTASTRQSYFGDERKEAWNQADLVVPQMANVPDVMLERLGVLPSPSAQSTFDRPFTADTQTGGRSGRYVSSEHEKTPTKPKKMSLPQSGPDALPKGPVSPLSPRESDNLDEDLYSATPTAPKRMEDQLEKATLLSLQQQISSQRPPEKAEEPIDVFPESGMTALGAAAALETSPDDDAGHAAGLSEDENFVDAHDHLAQTHTEETASRPSPVSDQGNPDAVMQIRNTHLDGLTVEHPLPQEGPVSPLPLDDADESRVFANETSVQPTLAEGLAPSNSRRAPTPDPKSDFMDRQYQSRGQATEERPLSFIVAPRDSNGVPLEHINSDPDPPDSSSEAIAVDLSGISGPPPPREPAPVDLSGLDGPPPGASAFDRQDWGATAPQYGDAPRASGLATHRVSDHWGLEGLVTSGPDAVGGDDEPPPEERRRRTSSGVWQKITGAKSRPDSRDESVPGCDGDATKENLPRSGKLSKKNKQAVQRSATTAATSPEPREQKRFSKLGSLFGRSTTTSGRSTPPAKTNRLTKRENVDRQDAQRPAIPTSNDASFQGPVETYAAYERLRKQQVLGYSVQPPSQSFEQGGGALPMDLRMQGREFDPSRNARQSPHSRIPEAFRPTEAGFVRGPEPIGPPADPLRPPSMSQQPTLPMNHPSWMQRFPEPAQEHSPNDPRQMSYSSQRSGQSQFQNFDWNTAPDLPSPQDELARSPAREYRDQQTPWAISLPRRSEEQQRRPQHPSRGPSWSQQRVHAPTSTEHWGSPAQIYDQEYPGPPVYGPSAFRPGPWPLPPEPGYNTPGQQHYRRASSHAPPPQHPSYSQPHSRRSVSGPVQNRNMMYPPLQTQGLPPVPAAGRGRYYGDSAPGRREDDGEGEVAPMSATSYPGQEWVPKER